MISGTGAYPVTFNNIVGGLHTTAPGPVDIFVGDAVDTATGGLSNHTHDLDIPDHNHDLTPEISTEYGVFEESGANTLAIGDLVIKLNGGSDLAGDVVNIGSDWYELDITEELVDSAFRPEQESNVIAITTAVEKSARIEAQLKIRGAVQAAAYD